MPDDTDAQKKEIAQGAEPKRTEQNDATASGDDTDAQKKEVAEV
jgi:hypothetical protein